MRLIALFAGVLFGSGCAIEPISTTQTVAYVSVEWSTPGRIATECGPTPHAGLTVIACYKDGRIIMRKIEGWNDHEGLETLGHEVLHALGGKHD